MNVYKKNIILLATLILCFALSIVYGYGFRNFIKQPKLPAAYSQYKSIDSGASSKNYEFKHLFNGEADEIYFENPIGIKNGVIIHVNSTDSDKSANIYYKIDQNGNLADSLIYSQNEYATALQKGYLIHNDYYRSWALDGDTSKHKYIPINYDLKLDSVARKNEFFKLNANAMASKFISHDYLWDNDDLKSEAKIDKFLFLIKDKWYALYGANLKEYEGQEINEPDTLQNQLKGEQILGKADNIIQVNYFYKSLRELTDGKIWWFGTGYVNLKVGLENIEIKHEMRYYEDTKTFSYLELKLYEDPNHKFKLLSNGNAIFYVIKPKSK